MYQQRFNMPCWVRRDVFFDLDPTKRLWVRAEIIAISSYANEVLSFVICFNGFIFHNVPIHLINLNPETQQPDNNAEGDYRECSCNCAAGPFYEQPLFKKGLCVWARLKSGGYQAHTYLTTIEWDAEQNQNVHLLVTGDGFLIVKTNPYVCFSEKPPQETPSWVSLTKTFRV